MKRILIILAMALLTVCLFSVANADVLFQTNRLEFTLPDSWYYEDACFSYVMCRHVENDILAEAFEVIDYRKTREFAEKSSEEIAELLIDAFNLKKYNPTMEEMEISGEKAVVVHFQTDKASGYSTIMNKGAYCAEVIYMAALGYEDVDFFKEAVGSIKARPREDAAYFRFGDAEVMYRGYRTKKVGKQTYLLLDFKWRNVGTLPDRFVINVDVKAFQDGIELKEGYLFAEDDETGTSIMPGKSLSCTKVFTLRKPTGEITFYVDKLMDISNEYVDRKEVFTIK